MFITFLGLVYAQKWKQMVFHHFIRASICPELPQITENGAQASIVSVSYTCDFDHKDRACHDKPFIIRNIHGNSNIRKGSRILKKMSK